MNRFDVLVAEVRAVMGKEDCYSVRSFELDNESSCAEAATNDRIYMNEQELDAHTDREVIAILLHEAGHVVNGHPRRLQFLQRATIALQTAALFLHHNLLIGLALQLVSSTLHYMAEIQADRYVADHGYGAEMQSMIGKTRSFRRYFGYVSHPPMWLRAIVLS